MHVVVSVGRPESLDELVLAHVAFVVRVQPVEEDFDFFVREAEVEGDQSCAQFAHLNCVRFISVNQFEAFLNGLVETHKVFTDFLEDASLPFLGVLRFSEVELLLNAFEGRVKFLVVKLVPVMLAQSER